MDPPRKKRGPYKTYAFYDESNVVPRTTKYRWSIQSTGGLRSQRPGAIIRNSHQKVHIQETIQSVVDEEILGEYPSDSLNVEDDLFEARHWNENSIGREDDAVSEQSIGTIREEIQFPAENDAQNPEINLSDISENQSREEDVVYMNIPFPGEDDVSNSTDNSNSLSRYSMKELIHFLLVLATKLRHNSTYCEAENISELIEVMRTTPNKPVSKYKMQKLINQLSKCMSIHHFCNSCGNYAGRIGVLDANEEENPHGILRCLSCDKGINVKANWDAGNIFIYLSLEYQLKELFERHGDSILYSKTRRKECSFAVEDIYDGQLYKKNVVHDMISINFSVDGVPIFDSSNYSMLPLLCTINELSPRRRPMTLLLCSLYCGSGKVPNMNAYLTPFIAECNKLKKYGFSYSYEGKLYRKTCQLLVGVCDSLARREVRNVMQFNGEYGCGFCKHPGEVVNKGAGHTRVYPIDPEGNAFGEGLRTHAETLLHFQQKEKGVKGRSILFDAEGFDVIRNLIPEWQHNVALGVVRQLSNLWFDSQNHNEEFYCGRSLALVDRLLSSIKPTLDVSRTPRKMTDRKHWKAHEWVIFLWCYSIPILMQILPNKYLHHWALLVDAIAILTSSSIIPADIFYARQCLFQFVHGIEILYGKIHVSYNIHLLTHLADSVLDWGPLWAHSAFPYENYNQNLLNFVKSSNSPALQICSSFRLKYVVYKLFDICSNDLTQTQENYLQKILEKTTCPKVTLPLSGVSLLGQPRIKTVQMQDFLALKRINVNINRGKIIRYYERIILHDEIYHSASYTRTVKRQNYFVLLRNLQIFKIEKFVVIEENENDLICYAIGYYFEKRRRPLIPDRRLMHMIVLERENTDLATVPVEEIPL